MVFNRDKHILLEINYNRLPAGKVDRSEKRETKKDAAREAVRKTRIKVAAYSRGGGR